MIIFLGGGRSVFAKAAGLITVGVLLMAAPPSYRLPKFIMLAFAALLAAPVLSFLPADWLGTIPEWRASLTGDWGIVLPRSASPQPMVTLESWAMFAVGIVWLVWCASRGSTTDDRRCVLRILCLGIAAIAVLTLMHKARTIHILWWTFPAEYGETFGPFPNRNHTSSLMAMGSVLCAAMAYDSYRSKGLGWAFFVMMMIPLMMVVVSNTSRAGVILLLLGFTAWVWTASLRKGFFKKAALMSTLVFGGISVVMIAGDSIKQRLASVATYGRMSGHLGARSAVYSDVMKMTSEAPWTGIGMGNFIDVFPQNASFHESHVRFFHPESDLLWIMVEGGMLTAILLLAALLMLVAQTGPWANSRDDESSSRQDRRLRHACAIAACIAGAHGIVDVPNHGMGYGLLSALLLALALRPSKVSTPATIADRLAFRITGGMAAVFGVAMLATFLGTPATTGRTSAKMLAQSARSLSANNRDGEALALAEKAIALNPLDWTNYFLRATLLLKLNRPESEAVLDFGRARALEPHYAMMCIEEGRVWLAHGSRLAIPAWGEFLRRQPERIDFYQQLLDLVSSSPGLKAEAKKLATTSALKLILLRYTPGPSEDFNVALHDLLDMPKGLAGLEPEGRQELFRIWQERGDRAELKAALTKNLSWQQDGWRVLCDELARGGDYQTAYRLATHYIQSPISSSVSDFHELDELRHNFDINPLDPRRGIDLYMALKTKGQWQDALETLEKISRLPSAPPYIVYEKSSIHAQQGDFRKAWELMSSYISLAKK